MGDETLEWDLKVDADTSGGTRMDAVLGRLDKTLQGVDAHLKRMEGDSEGAAKAHKKHADHAHGLLGVLQRVVHQGMEPFLHKAKEIAEFEFIREATEKLIELPRELASEIKHLGEEMLNAAIHEERFGLAFRNALGEEDAEKTERYIDRIRKHTEFTKDQLEAMNLELAKSGFRGGELAKANEALIDLASMSANPQEGADAAMGALKRVMISGRLDARALRPFGINQKTFFEELSRETGIGITALKKKMDKGKVEVGATLNSLYTVITEKTGKALGGAGADMEKTFGTRLKNLKEIPELLGEKLAGTKGYAAISDFVGRIADAFDPDSPEGQRLQQALTGIIDTIGEQLEGIDVAHVAESVTDAMTSVSNAVGPVITIMKDLYHATSAAFGAFEKGAQFLHDTNLFGIGSAEDAITNHLIKKQYGEQYGKQGERFNPNFDMAAAKAEIARRRAAGTFNTANDNFAEGMAQRQQVFETVGGMFGLSLEKGFRKKTKTHSPSQLFAEMGSDVAAGFADGLEAGTSRVDQAMERMVVPAAPPAAGSAGAATAPVIHFVLQQTNHLSGSDAETIPDAIAEKIKEIVPGALESAFEQMAMQTGGRV